MAKICHPKSNNKGRFSFHKLAMIFTLKTNKTKQKQKAKQNNNNLLQLVLQFLGLVCDICSCIVRVRGERDKDLEILLGKHDFFLKQCDARC